MIFFLEFGYFKHIYNLVAGELFYKIKINNNLNLFNYICSKTLKNFRAWITLVLLRIIQGLFFVKKLGIKSVRITWIA
jgi:hypothetical protein